MTNGVRSISARAGCFAARHTEAGGERFTSRASLGIATRTFARAASIRNGVCATGRAGISSHTTPIASGAHAAAGSQDLVHSATHTRRFRSRVAALTDAGAVWSKRLMFSATVSGIVDAADQCAEREDSG